MKRGDVTKRVENTILCTASSFNATKEVNGTKCRCLHARRALDEVQTVGSVCAVEGEPCRCFGRAHLGALSKYVQGSISCDSASFDGGDEDHFGVDEDRVCRCENEEPPELPSNLRMKVIWIGDGTRPGCLTDIIDLLKKAFDVNEVVRIDPVLFDDAEVSSQCGFRKPYPLGVAGTTAAHREAWRHFLGCSPVSSGCRRSMLCYFGENGSSSCQRDDEDDDDENEWAIILEDDIFMSPLILQNQSDVVHELRRQLSMAIRDKSDVMYLGYCSMPSASPEHDYSLKNWLCLHAYAVNKRAARSLHRWVKVECTPEEPNFAPSVDAMTRALCNSKYRDVFPREVPQSDLLPCTNAHDFPPTFSIIPHEFEYQPKKAVYFPMKGLIFQVNAASLRTTVNKMKSEKLHFVKAINAGNDANRPRNRVLNYD